VIEPANFDFERFGSAAVNVLMFAALFIAFGVGTAHAFEAIRRLVERGGVVGTATEIFAWLTALVGITFGALTLFETQGVGGIPVAVWVAIALIVPPIVLWRRLPRAIGYAAFALPILAGGFELASGLPQLLN
jgi:hypothetical protein